MRMTLLLLDRFRLQFSMGIKHVMSSWNDNLMEINVHVDGLGKILVEVRSE